MMLILLKSLHYRATTKFNFCICRAASFGCYEEVKFILQQSKNEPLPNLHTNKSPLFIACKNFRHDIAELLLQHHPKLLFVSEAHGRINPLHVACFK